MKNTARNKSRSKGDRKGLLRDPAIYRYNFRLNSVENTKFLNSFKQSKMQEKSKFIKAMLLDKEMKVVFLNKAAMDYYMRLTHFYKQYQAIGTNYNQVVKVLKTNFDEKRGLTMLYRLEKETIELVQITQKLFQLTDEFEQKWLQK